MGRAPPAAFMLTREQVVELAKKRGYPVQFMSDAEIFRVMQPELTSMKSDHQQQQQQQQQQGWREASAAAEQQRSLPAGMPPAPLGGNTSPHGNTSANVNAWTPMEAMGAMGPGGGGAQEGQQQLSRDERALIARSSTRVNQQDAGGHGIGPPPRDSRQTLNVADAMAGLYTMTPPDP
jgi:hypothetical protein